MRKPLLHRRQHRDDDGSLLFASDHDENASTALKCFRSDLAAPNSYDDFAYDAVFLVAHALHQLVEVQNRTEVVGKELVDAVLRTEFDGVTGRIELTDSSADPDRLYHGDRRMGITYSVLNYAGGTSK